MVPAIPEIQATLEVLAAEVTGVVEIHVGETIPDTFDMDTTWGRPAQAGDGTSNRNIFLAATRRFGAGAAAQAAVVRGHPEIPVALALPEIHRLH